MKLNLKCLGDILLAIESFPGCNGCDFISWGEFRNRFDNLKKYSDDEVEYHFKQANLSGLVDGYKQYVSGDFFIKDLSPKGHEALKEVRENTVVNNVKRGAVSAVKKAGETATNGIITLAFDCLKKFL